MEEIAKLEHLAIVNRIYSELENHLGEAEVSMAEFLIHLAQQNPTFDKFKNALAEADAEGDLSDALIGTILRLINQSSVIKNADPVNKRDMNDKELMKALVPALAIPDEEPKLELDWMNELEMLGNTVEIKKDEKREAKSPQQQQSDRKRRHRSRSNSHERHQKRDGDSRDRHQRRYEDSRDRHGRIDDNHRRSRSNDRHSRKRRSRSREDKRHRHRSHSGDRYPKSSNHRDHKPKQKLHEKPEVGMIINARINKIVTFGAFANMMGFEKTFDGLIHISQINSERVENVSHYLERGQTVKVKIINMNEGKIGLSMKEVDQSSGEDLKPNKPVLTGANCIEAGDDVFMNPVGSPTRGRQMDDDSKPIKKARVRMSSQERWELQQMRGAGALKNCDLPDFDDEYGVLPDEDELNDIEDTEIELVEDEPDFLKGLGQAAIMQSGLHKARKEAKTKSRREQEDEKNRNIQRGATTQDPMARKKVDVEEEEMAPRAAATKDMPEWYKHVTQEGRVTYGQKTALSIQEQRDSLPIFKLKTQLVQAITDNSILVVIGETGSGKTTQLTQYIAEAGFAKRGKIGCTQPRRVAAMSVAKRVAEEYGCRLGEKVGYTIRFEDCTSPETIIKYMTDGMLLKECLFDPDLKSYSCIMLDEAHERTINTDVLFGLLKKAVKKRPELKIIVTSATLESKKFSEYFFNAPIFTIPGRTFPVEIMYTQSPESDYLEAAVNVVMQIHLAEPKGDILLFLTGQEEIDTSCEILYNRMKSLKDAPELIILPVYGALPSEVQTRIFEPAPEGKRKVVIATNIAETSLTIDGIYYVVDPGFVKQKIYNPKSGMDSLVVTPISQAAANQRSGRAGRTGPGKCYRLFTKDAYNNEMLPAPVPEIQRTNLAATLLQLKAMGINDLLNFDFMDAPAGESMLVALRTLHDLSALDNDGLLSILGRRMAEFPLEPSLSKLLIMSVDLGCSDDILTIVSMISVQNVFYRPKEKQEQADQKRSKFNQPEGDHVTLLAIYKSWQHANYSSQWCFDNFIQAKTMKRAQDVRKQLLSIMERHKFKVVSCGKNYQKVQKAICSGFFRNAAKKDPQEGYRTLTDGQNVYLHPASALYQQQSEWVVYHELMMTTKEYMREITAIEPKWLVEFAPSFFRISDHTKLSANKKHQKIDPLHNKFEAADAWRISKVKKKIYNPNR
uniref:RNA helicase n=1 Tax=Rhabditophanes sp. KR3021 TaxID=114890 RepID=A0AC35TR15_9BILA